DGVLSPLTDEQVDVIVRDLAPPPPPGPGGGGGATAASRTKWW
ncbi:hypothetical protein J2X26_001220, partial [Cellulomonas humilata]|nr:hypothetical protein [Cellulomonas humilata]